MEKRAKATREQNAKATTKKNAKGARGAKDGDAVSRLAGALEGGDEIELTVTGRVSHRQTTRPVWFVLERGTLYLLPVKGSDTGWYKNVLETPGVGVSADGVSWTGNAMPITVPARVRDVVEKFRAKYGARQIGKYYTDLDVAAKVPLA